MKLLIDEMFPPSIAAQLRARQHDAAGVAADPRLAGLTDEEVFTSAQAEERAIVTENVPDFRRVARDWEAGGRLHHGLIYTTNRKFPRHHPGTFGRVVAVLAALEEATPADQPPSNREIWL